MLQKKPIFFKCAVTKELKTKELKG